MGIDELVWQSFGKMHIRYASQWVAKWQGLDMLAVHRDWCEVLARCTPTMFAYAIENLPGTFPPSAEEFRKLCAFAPAPPEPKPDPSIALPKPDMPRLANEMRDGMARGKAAAQAEADRLMADLVRKNPHKAWAFRLQDMHRRGFKLKPVQITMYRAALATVAPQLPTGGFTAPSLDTLPPAMRADATRRDSLQQDGETDHEH